MPNFSPVFTKIARSAWATLTAANTAKDGTGTTSLVVTADTTEGGMFLGLVCEPLGTNTTSTILRVFLNNGLTPATVANNSLIGQIALPITTLSETSTATLQAIERIFNRPLPPGYRIYVCLASAAAAGWQITGLSGDYTT